MAMSSTISATILLTQIIISTSLISGATIITSLNVPSVVHNGTGPFELSCHYQVDPEENGLVIEWYRNSDQIYQWIPPMPPQDAGVIQHFAEYPVNNLLRPGSRSVIRLRLITMDMSGDYTCSVSTIQEKVSRTSGMLVYVPEKNVRVTAKPFNESHTILSCTVVGVRPISILKIFVENVPIDGNRYPGRMISELIPSPEDPVVVACEVTIPGTDYKRRKSVVYYPIQYLQPNGTRKYFSNPIVDLVITSTFILSFHGVF